MRWHITQGIATHRIVAAADRHLKLHKIVGVSCGRIADGLSRTDALRGIIPVRDGEQHERAPCALVRCPDVGISVVELLQTLLRSKAALELPDQEPAQQRRVSVVKEEFCLFSRCKLIQEKLVHRRPSAVVVARFDVDFGLEVIFLGVKLEVKAISAVVIATLAMPAENKPRYHRSNHRDQGPDKWRNVAA